MMMEKQTNVAYNTVNATTGEAIKLEGIGMEAIGARASFKLIIFVFHTLTS